jgi:hypothetical protein
MIHVNCSPSPQPPRGRPTGLSLPAAGAAPRPGHGQVILSRLQLRLVAAQRPAAQRGQAIRQAVGGREGGLGRWAGGEGRAQASSRQRVPGRTRAAASLWRGNGSAGCAPCRAPLLPLRSSAWQPLPAGSSPAQPAARAPTHPPRPHSLPSPPHLRAAASSSSSDCSELRVMPSSPRAASSAASSAAACALRAASSSNRAPSRAATSASSPRLARSSSAGMGRAARGGWASGRVGGCGWWKRAGGRLQGGSARLSLPAATASACRALGPAARG